MYGQFKGNSGENQMLEEVKQSYKAQQTIGVKHFITNSEAFTSH
jgi:hypothetical protein